MAATLAEHIISLIDPAAELYHRLILVVGPAGSGKTEALQHVAERTGWPRLNLNLELARQLLDLTERQRRLLLPRLLAELLEPYNSEVILLDNLEILFTVSFHQDPLRLLLGLARHRTVVAAWPGSMTAGKLVYAEPGHPEYRRYPVQDFIVVTTMPNAAG